jgi:hypothetical protein
MHKPCQSQTNETNNNATNILYIRKLLIKKITCKHFLNYYDYYCQCDTENTINFCKIKIILQQCCQRIRSSHFHNMYDALDGNKLRGLSKLKII